MMITGRAGRGVAVDLPAAVVLALLVGATGAFAQVTVDDFGDTQAVSTGGTASNQVAQAVGTILGGERDMEVSLVSGAGTVTGDANTTTASALTFSVPSGGTGRLLVTWDGSDGSDDLDPIGLAGVDLTAAGANALKLGGITVSGTVQVAVEVYTDAANVARAARKISAAGDLILPFGEFQNKLGTPDFTDVGAITLELVATGAATLGIADVLTVAPAVVATKTDLVVGGDLDGLGDPGETVRYTIEISTTGGTAEGVSLEDTVNPSQLTFTTGSLQATPLALDDSFGCLGNVGLAIVAPGLLGNDSDPDGSGLAATPISAVNTGSTVGTVSVNTTTGAFTYDPPAGFKGVDTFTYTIDDDDGNFDTGTVTIDCSQVLWFIDNSVSGGANNGTLADPFESLAAFNAANGGGAGKPAAGDCMFLEETGTDYTGGVTLLDGQRLVGEGAAVDLGTACGVTPPAGSQTLPATGGTRPKILNAAGAGITLAQDNSLRGLEVGDTSGGAGVSGSNFGTLTVRETAIGGGGPALDLDNGTLDAEFVSIASTSGAAGIDLDTVGGSLEVTATTIDGTMGTALKVANAPGGSFDFGDTDLGVTSTVDAGIDLTSNAGATFTFDSLDVDADNGKGLNASATGTVNIGGTAATIAAAGGPALDLGTITLDNGAGSGGWSLARVSSTGSSAEGIDIDGVTGNLTIDDGNAGTFDDLKVSNSTNAGIDIATSAGTFTFDSVDIDNTGSHGVRVSGSGSVAINGGSIDGVTGDGVNSTNTPLTVDFVSIGANAAITDDGIEVVNSDGLARAVTLTNNNIFKVGMAGGIGNRGIFINASGAGLLTASVQANQIESANETLLTQDGGAGTRLVLDLQNSTLTRLSAGPTERHVGSTLNSTIVRSWSGPNQVVGAATPVGGGILFDRITFDSDANPGNGFQQVDLSGTLDIGQSGGRVAGDGLALDCVTGDLKVATLNVFNNAGTGVEVHTKSGLCGGTATTFNLDTTAGTVDTTAGIALDLDPLTGGMTFTKVSSSNSPSAGIRVDNLNGSLTVAGSGGTCTETTPTCSGGTITGAATDGVSLVDTKDISLTRMNINNTGRHGIFANRVDDFALAFSRLNTLGNANDEEGIQILDGSGVYSITNSYITDAADDAVEIQFTTAKTISSLTISDNFFEGIGDFPGGVFNSAAGNNFAGAGLDLDVVKGATVTTATMNNMDIRNFDGRGISIDVGDAGSGGTLTSMSIDNAFVDGVGTIGLAITGDGVGGGASGSATVNVTDSMVLRSDNTVSFNIETGGDAALVVAAARNTFSVVNETFFGVTCIRVVNDGNVVSDAPTIRATLHQNTCTDPGDVMPLRAFSRGSQGRLDLRLTNNTVAANAGSFSDGSEINSGNGTTGEADTVCLEVSANNSDGDTLVFPGFPAGIRLVQQTGTTFQIANYGGSGTTATTIESFIDLGNPLSSPPSDVDLSTGVVNFTALGVGNFCNTPPVPP